MSKLEDFYEGQRVAHITIGDGYVVSKNDNSITVRYDRKDTEKKRAEGIYDKRWFELHPNYLFHRRMP